METYSVQVAYYKFCFYTRLGGYLFESNQQIFSKISSYLSAPNLPKYKTTLYQQAIWQSILSIVIYRLSIYNYRKPEAAHHSDTQTFATEFVRYGVNLFVCSIRGNEAI